MSYSNSGYVLLGYLIEKISGESYEKFVQENIFTPLAMKDSGYDSNFAIIPHRVEGYEAGPNGLIHAGFINMTVPFSAGALYSTTEDLQRWEQELFGGKVLSASSLQKMATPFRNNYAFGLVVHAMNGHKVIEHGGGIEGFNTMLAYYPEEKLTVIVLGNVSGSAPQEIAAKLAAVVYGEKVVLPSEHQEVKVDAKLFDGYVGTKPVTLPKSRGRVRSNVFRRDLCRQQRGAVHDCAAGSRGSAGEQTLARIRGSESPAEGQHVGRDRSQSTVQGRWMG
jgi:CubicO group peptidase (beta-lactamase class C family)